MLIGEENESEEVRAFNEHVSRQRLDFQELPDGSTEATLTVTLPDGSEHRYTAITDAAEVEEMAGAIATMEADAGGEAVEGIFGDIWRGVKKGVSAVGKVTKKVVTSKVFKLAAKGLAVIAPALGPLAPAALGAASAMGVASSLASAGVAAEAGAKKAAKLLTAKAASDAKRVTRSPAAAASLLRIANVKRKGAVALAAAPSAPRPSTAIVRAAPPRPSAPRPTATAARPAPAAPRSGADVVTAARTGRLRSNKPGSVSRDQLLAAHSAGRVFWVG